MLVILEKVESLHLVCHMKDRVLMPALLNTTEVFLQKIWFLCSNNNCMINDSVVYNATEYETFLRDLPGQKYSLDQQCQDLTGQSGAISAGRLTQVCSTMQCMISSEITSTFTNTALDFTSCGHKRVNI